MESSTGNGEREESEECIGQYISMPRIYSSSTLFRQDGESLARATKFHC
jgi:hypothetical protein